MDEQATPTRQRFALIPVEGGQRTKVFDLPQPLEQIVHWMSDGHALTYIDMRDGKQLAVARGSIASDVVLIGGFR